MLLETSLGGQSNGQEQSVGGGHPGQSVGLIGGGLGQAVKTEDWKINVFLTAHFKNGEQFLHGLMYLP